MGSMDQNVKLYKQTLSYRKTGAPCQCLAQPWFIRVPHPVYDPRHGCELEPKLCGQNVFRQIAEDIKNAKHSVDIITWGFDPGMVLNREGSAENGQRYGDLLKEVAGRSSPVRVRLLVWHDDAATQKLMNNLPDFYGRLYQGIANGSRGFYSDAHCKYNAEWFAQFRSGADANIHFHVRDISGVHMVGALKDETLPDGVLTNPKGISSVMYPAHHQKMVLIDYEYPADAVGYVMGHNSITDFWDTTDHVFQDPLRERFFCKEESALRRLAVGDHVSPSDIAFGYRQTQRGKQEHQKMVDRYLADNSSVAKPYQDVSCRLRGPVLYDLNLNFCQAWSESKPPGSLFFDTCRAFLNLAPVAKKLAQSAHDKVVSALHHEMDGDFIKRRAKIPWTAFQLPNGRHSVQLIRTQPMHGEKGVKECYANLTRQMQHYMFIQNQYIQYVTWAEHLLNCVSKLRQAGFNKPLYIFLLTSTPEMNGMDTPTYDVASKVGMSATMTVEHQEAVERARQGKGEQPISPAALQKQGVNVVMCSLWTCAKGEKLRRDDYEEIYIHAKVAVVDDAAFTIGSANLNLRSMAMDSELNVLSQAHEVAFQLRCDLFGQCTGELGPAQFADMGRTFRHWQTLTFKNRGKMGDGEQLKGHLLPFHVDRKPGAPVV